MEKSRDAFRTISEVAEWLDTPAHVLRFWESRFAQVKPVKRAGGRRYYRPADMLLLGGIKKLLHEDGMTIRGVQKLLREEGVKHVAGLSVPLDGVASETIDAQVSSAADVASQADARPEADAPAREVHEAPIELDVPVPPADNVVALTPTMRAEASPEAEVAPQELPQEDDAPESVSEPVTARPPQTEAGPSEADLTAAPSDDGEDPEGAEDAPDAEAEAPPLPVMGFGRGRLGRDSEEASAEAQPSVPEETNPEAAVPLGAYVPDDPEDPDAADAQPGEGAVLAKALRKLKPGSDQSTLASHLDRLQALRGRMDANRG